MCTSSSVVNVTEGVTGWSVVSVRGVVASAVTVPHHKVIIIVVMRIFLTALRVVGRLVSKTCDDI